MSEEIDELFRELESSNNTNEVRGWLHGSTTSSDHSDATKLPIERNIFYIVSIVLSIASSIVGILIIFRPSEYRLYDWLWLFVPTWILILIGVVKKW